MNFHPLSFRLLSCLPNLMTTGALALLVGNVGASTLVWKEALDFNEFEGSGGFEEDRPLVVLESALGGGGSHSGQYNVLESSGIDGVTGVTKYRVGQDAASDDIMFRTRTWSAIKGNWAAAELRKARDTYQAYVFAPDQSSKPGDFAVMALEMEFGSHVKVSADQFSMGVSSANGRGEMYEWTFITLGGVDDAPFAPGDFGKYDHKVYSDLSESTFYKEDGTADPGGAARNETIKKGKTISQFLNGEPSGSVVEQRVERGWYALDNFNVDIMDSEEQNFGNPEPLTNTLLSSNVSGMDLGLDPDELIDKVTIWFGYYDVALDSDGDGFTRTYANQEAFLNQMTIGYSATPIPEPSSSLVAVAAFVLLALRRRRCG